MISDRYYNNFNLTKQLFYKDITLKFFYVHIITLKVRVNETNEKYFISSVAILYDRLLN